MLTMLLSVLKWLTINVIDIKIQIYMKIHMNI